MKTELKRESKSSEIEKEETNKHFKRYQKLNTNKKITLELEEMNL